jgi:hypothetical protein
VVDAATTRTEAGQFARDYPDVTLDLTTIEERTQPTRCDLTSTGAHHAAQ